VRGVRGVRVAGCRYSCMAVRPLTPSSRCADTRYDYMHTGCSSISGAGITYGILGCTARAGWMSPFCGMRVERVGDDFLDTSLADSTIGYPRTITQGGVFNGEVVTEHKCWSPVECENICSRMSRQAREANLPEPEACALCEPICVSNIGTTITSVIGAFAHDVMQTVQLITTCFGPSGITGCICNLMMTMKPTWIANLPTAEQKCRLASHPRFLPSPACSHSAVRLDR